MDRRALLALAGSGLATLAGCSESRPVQARIAYVWLINDSDRTREVTVTLTEDEETVFEKTYTLAPDGETSNVSEDRPVEGAGTYTLDVETGSQTITADTTDYVDQETDEDCIGLKVLVDTTGNARFQPTSMQRCGATTSA